MKMELKVKGMTCGHCDAAVARAVKSVASQAEILVDRAHQRVAITGAADAERVTNAIRAAGFDVAPDE
jgi:copper chaperone